MLTDLLKKRRSRYQLTNQLPITQAQLQQIITDCLLYTPSAFNVQSARVILLLGERHQKLWDITRSSLRAIVPADKFAPTEEKINSFAAAYGTILYFEDTTAVQKLQAQYPAYAANFPVWAQQANGMLQFAIWTALAEAGVGASLQHYNPLIDKPVQKEFKVPDNWQLIAQMPFGKATGADSEKTFLPITDRLRIEK